MTKYHAHRRSPWRENIEAIATAIVLALVIRHFCFEAFQTSWNRADGAHQVCRFSGGVIKNNAGTTTLVKAPTVIANDGAENQVTFAADDVGDRLAVTITGKAGKTIETRVIVTGAFLSV